MYEAFFFSQLIDMIQALFNAIAKYRLDRVAGRDCCTIVGSDLDGWTITHQGDVVQGFVALFRCLQNHTVGWFAFA